MSETIEVKTSEASPVKRRMTQELWAEATAMRASGEYTLSELSEKFGVTIETLSRRFKRDNVKKGEDSVASLIKRSVVDSAATRAKERAERAENRRNDFDGYANAIAKLVVKTVATCSKEGKPFSTIEGDIKALQRAADAINKSFATVSKALQLDIVEGEEDDIPKLLVGQLTEEQVRQYRQIQHEEDSTEEFEDEDVEAMADDIMVDSVLIPSDDVQHDVAEKIISDSR